MSAHNPIMAYNPQTGMSYTFDPATGTFSRQKDENDDEITQEIVPVKEERPTKNGTNEICHFCGARTVPMIGRQMICTRCQK